MFPSNFFVFLISMFPSNKNAKHMDQKKKWDNFIEHKYAKFKT